MQTSAKNLENGLHSGDFDCRSKHPILLIACGALAREIIALVDRNAWDHVHVTCLPAIWHNTPAKIPAAVRAKIRANRHRFEHIYVVYGDCGTGGRLDAVLAVEGVHRIAGPHCYSFFATQSIFDALAGEEPGSFYLTDYLVRHFDRLIVDGLGLDRYPEMLNMVFGRYKRLVYLAQTDDDDLSRRARAAAERLRLDYEYRLTGFGDLERFVSAAATDQAGGCLGCSRNCRVDLSAETQGTAGSPDGVPRSMPLE